MLSFAGCIQEEMPSKEGVEQSDGCWSNGRINRGIKQVYPEVSQDPNTPYYDMFVHIGAVETGSILVYIPSVIYTQYMYICYVWAALLHCYRSSEAET